MLEYMDLDACPDCLREGHNVRLCSIHTLHLRLDKLEQALAMAGVSYHPVFMVNGEVWIRRFQTGEATNG